MIWDGGVGVAPAVLRYSCFICFAVFFVAVLFVGLTCSSLREHGRYVGSVGKKGMATVGGLIEAGKGGKGGRGNLKAVTPLTENPACLAYCLHCTGSDSPL